MTIWRDNQFITEKFKYSNQRNHWSECEFQGHESEEFLALFNYNIKYEKGGVESGFRHVEKGFYEPRLLHIKGKKIIRANLVETTVESLTKEDSFILDLGMSIYIWNGPGTLTYQPNS